MACNTFSNTETSCCGYEAPTNYATPTQCGYTGQTQYDGGQQFVTPNTSSPYLNSVSIDNGDSNSCSQGNSGQPCDWISTQFNGNIDGTYQVEVRNHNIYVTTADGEESMAQPQMYDPNYQAECARRDQNFYAQQQPLYMQSQSYDCNNQPQQAYYPTYNPQSNYYDPQPNYYYPQQEQAAPGVQVGLGVGFLGGLLLGVLGVGRRCGYGYSPYSYNPGYNNQELESYSPSGTVVNQGYYNPVYNQTSFVNPSEYGQYNPSSYINCNSYNASQNYEANQYYANLTNQGINPQYSSGIYPGTYESQQY